MKKSTMTHAEAGRLGGLRRKANPELKSYSGRKSGWDGLGPSGPDYRERPEFREYLQSIFDVIAAADAPLSIGDLHRALGPGARREWTADALDLLGVVEIGLLPTRYRLPDRAAISGYTAKKWACGVIEI